MWFLFLILFVLAGTGIFRHLFKLLLILFILGWLFG